MERFYSFVFAVICAFFSVVASAAEFKVVFINPGHPQGDDTGEFWSEVDRFMQASAKDLNIELTTLFANRNHIEMKRLANILTVHEPDYVILVNEKGVGVDLVRLIAPHQIPIFSLLNGFTENELTKLTPQEKSLLIGSLVPNNFLAGQGLMDGLYQHHIKAENEAKPLEVLALLGDYRSWAATERQAGLNSAINRNKQLKLLDSTVANWSKGEAYRKVKGILRRQNVDIIWAANDPMAFGAREAVREAGLTDQITIGGINWDVAYQNSPFDLSFGGHVILGANSLVMLADHHRGLMQHCEMNAEHNIFQSSSGDKLSKFIANTNGNNIEQFDFTQFSKRHNNPAPYDLNVFIEHDYQTRPYSVPQNSCSSAP